MERVRSVARFEVQIFMYFKLVLLPNSRQTIKGHWELLFRTAR